MTDGMCRIPGGSFRPGSEDFYPEERPVRGVDVDDVGRFVRELGYVTVVRS